jgi:penicillin amidase
VGSNNWTIAGRLTATGKPILASDPHRPVTLPSLRYLVHLNCPPRGADRGWNVIGGTEPALPGVALGHNERIAWGMTIVGTDQMDIYVEDTHPDDANRYRVGDEWRPMRIERELLRVRGEPQPREVELKLARHGPVIFEDRERHRAYALRWTGSEPGTAGYLAALTVNRAENWPEFLEAANRWKIPGLNLVYADRDGHIGWIAAALTPVRRNWDGLLPVPGASGKYEWDGFLPTAELPQWFDPPEGYIATANHNILTPGYRHQISYEWAAPFRFGRIDEVFRQRVQAGHKFSIDDSRHLQHDATSLPARRLLAVLRNMKVDDPSVRSNADLLLRWDAVLARDSAAAALYAVWQSKLGERVFKPRIPEKLWSSYSARLPLQVALDLIEQPDSSFGPDPRAARDTLLIDALRDAASDLQKRLGPDPATWQWGKLHQATLRHMLTQDLKVEGQKEDEEHKSIDQAVLAAVFNLPPVPRAGDGNTPLAAGGPRAGNFDQTTGASYRHIVDLADWDRSVATSTPGQSGQPTSPHYGDLLSLWAEGKYFPLPFSRRAVEAASPDRLILNPK